MRYASKISDTKAILLNHFLYSFIVSVFGNELYKRVTSLRGSPWHTFASHTIPCDDKPSLPVLSLLKTVTGCNNFWLSGIRNTTNFCAAFFPCSIVIFLILVPTFHTLRQCDGIKWSDWSSRCLRFVSASEACADGADFPSTIWPTTAPAVATATPSAIWVTPLAHSLEACLVCNMSKVRFRSSQQKSLLTCHKTFATIYFSVINCILSKNRNPIVIMATWHTSWTITKSLDLVSHTTLLCLHFTQDVKVLNSDNLSSKNTACVCFRFFKLHPNHRQKKQSCQH